MRVKLRLLSAGLTLSLGIFCGDASASPFTKSTVDAKLATLLRQPTQYSNFGGRGLGRTKYPGMGGRRIFQPHGYNASQPGRYAPKYPRGRQVYLPSVPLTYRPANAKFDRYWRVRANRVVIPYEPSCARRYGCHGRGAVSPFHPTWRSPLKQAYNARAYWRNTPSSPVQTIVEVSPTPNGQAGNAAVAPTRPVVNPPSFVPPPNPLPSPVDALLTGKSYRKGEILVEVSKDSPADIGQSLAASYRSEVIDSRLISLLGSRILLLRLRPDQEMRSLLILMSRDSRIRSVQPNYIYKAAQTTTSVGGNQQHRFAYPKLPEANRNSTGFGVKVAIVDTCIDREHDELEGAVGAFFDAINPGSSACEAENHGTAIAGLIGGRAQLRGVAPAATLLSARALMATAEAPEPSGTSQSILLALDWSASQQARIINMSIAGPDDPLVRRSVAVVHSKGIVIVAAAGNAGPLSAPLYPAAYPEAIAVTAVDGKQRLYSDANRGPHICVAARGVDVILARAHGVYDHDSGTSYAAATVSGAVALLLEKRARATPDNVREALQETAIAVGQPTKSNLFGYGLVNVKAATAFVEAKLSK